MSKSKPPPSIPPPPNCAVFHAVALILENGTQSPTSIITYTLPWPVIPEGHAIQKPLVHLSLSVPIVTTFIQTLFM